MTTDTTDEYDPPTGVDAADSIPEPTKEDYAAVAAALLAEHPDTDATADTAAEDDGNLNKRQARYRRQLRETEAERDQLRATVETMQRAEVERLASKAIQKPTALWSADVQLADLLDDTGAVDPAKVNTAVQNARDTLGLATTRPPGYVRGEGQFVGEPAAGNVWENAFKG